MFRVSEYACTWARGRIPKEWRKTNDYLSQYFYNFTHWSRGFEYPWTLVNGRFDSGALVLDAASGDSPIPALLPENRIVCVDLLPSLNNQRENTEYVAADLRHLPFADFSFATVLCTSALEHIKNPQEIMLELWRVLARDGRLVITMDVVDEVCNGFYVDSKMAKKILDLFGLVVPEEPSDLVSASWTENNHKVYIKVLCFFVEKF